MKKLYILIIVTLFSLQLSAQTKTKLDIVQKNNGEEMKGKVIRVTDTDVSFIYAGETVEYVIKKSEILKIVHASGRVENFGETAMPAQTRQKDAVAMSATSADHHNKIAILPFTFIMDNKPGADEIGLKAQEDTFGFLSQHSAGYTILDPRTTNALLVKAGMTRDKMIGFTMKEICDALGVEYVIDGSVTQTTGYATSYSSGSTNSKVKRDGDEKVKGVSSTSSNYGNSVQRYGVAVSLHIYMDNNASIYNQSHRAFLTNTDGSYSSPLEYLLKRCPLYRK